MKRRNFLKALALATLIPSLEWAAPAVEVEPVHVAGMWDEYWTQTMVAMRGHLTDYTLEDTPVISYARAGKSQGKEVVLPLLYRKQEVT